MVKIPEKVPKKELSFDVYRKMFDKDIQNKLKKATEEYLYWDDFKYIKLPDDVKPDDAWTYVKEMRQFQFIDTPIKDKTNNKFVYWVPSNFQKILHYIDQNAGGQIFSEDPRVPTGEADRYVVSTLMEEAIASSQLEGAATTRKKAKEMLRSGRKPVNKAEKMILNNYITISKITDMSKEKLSKDLIFDIQTMLTKETLEDPSASGRFRRRDEEIHVVDQEDGISLHIPPDAHELEERIEELINYANNDDGDFVHPVVKAIILHFSLAYIHPFVDGNGRTARAIFYWYMLKHEYRLFEYLPISRIIKKRAKRYAKAYLYTEIDDLDLTYFLKYNLDCVNETIKDFMKYMKAKQKETRDATKFIKECPGLNYRQSELLRYAIAHPFARYTIKYHKNIHNIVYQTARADLLSLESKGFLEKKQIGQAFVYVPVKDINDRLKTSIEK